MITKREEVKFEVEPNGVIFVRSVIIIEEDGVLLSSLPPHRRPIEPDFTHSETDRRVVGLIDLFWTPEVIEDYKNKKKSSSGIG